MKHVFIINPTAGSRDCTARMMEMAKGLAARHNLDVDCILTQRPGHAMETARALAQGGGEVRVYACGGDGTVNEVANGIAGFDNAAMTCIPTGTGNDFLRNFGGAVPLFSDAENLWDGPAFLLDALDCGGRRALTVVCSGFDAQVAADVHQYGTSGKGSYILSLAVNFLLRRLGRRWTITLDGEVLSGEFVLAAVCNGRYYGGGFMPVAEARMDDGVLHTLMVKKVSRPAFLRFVGAYSKGLYYTLPDVARCCTARTVTIESPEEDIVTCLDGECVYNRRISIGLSEKKVRFFGPRGCDPNATCRPLPGQPVV